MNPHFAWLWPWPWPRPWPSALTAMHLFPVCTIGNASLWGHFGDTFSILFRLFFGLVPGVLPGRLGIVERCSRDILGVFRVMFFRCFSDLFQTAACETLTFDNISKNPRVLENTPLG